MSNPQNSRLTKNERREQAREEARQLREAARRKERRNRLLLQGGIIVAVLAVVLVVVLVIVNGAKPAGAGPRNMISDGILIQPGGDVYRTGGLPADQDPQPNPAPTDSNVVAIQTYIDYFCPYCNAFETTNGEYIQTLVDSGAASLEVFPVAILDGSSLGTKYSTRAANAAACVADSAPSTFLDFTSLMYQNQPEEQTSGLSDAEIVGIAKQAGATSDVVEGCIRGGTFEGWVGKSTARALNNQALWGGTPGTQNYGFGTPTVFVNGARYNGSISDLATFRAFVEQQAGQAFIQSTPSPTPTPTGTATP